MELFLPEKSIHVIDKMVLTFSQNFTVVTGVYFLRGERVKVTNKTTQ